MRKLALAFLVCCAVNAQTFEVASIKASPPPDGRGMRVGATGGPGSKDPGRWTAQNMSLSNLVTVAYDLKMYQLNAPSWLNMERFDINAKVPEGATKEEFKRMVQNMLEERFKLTIHREKKEMPVYEMVVAKNGLKLKESVEAPQPDGAAPAGPPPGGPPRFTIDKDGFPELPPGSGPMTVMMNGKARTRASNATMEQLASMLSGQVGKPVTDATGLKGKYDYMLSWASGGMGRGLGGPPPPPPPGGGAVGAGGAPGAAMPDDDTGPTIFTAIQEQLGLKLDQKKGMVEIVVVDHIEKTPTEN